MEGNDLKTFVEQLFLDLEDPGSNFNILVKSAFRFGPLNRFRKVPRDILV